MWKYLITNKPENVSPIGAMFVCLLLNNIFFYEFFFAIGRTPNLLHSQTLDQTYPLTDTTAAYQLFIKLPDAQNKPQNIDIECFVPPIKEKYATFIIPLNTHHIYGKQVINKIISDFAPYNKQGKRLPYHFETNNGIVIEHAKELYRIVYTLKKNNQATANFDHNCFVLNRNGYFGYLQGYAHLPYMIRIEHPPELFGATALPKKQYINSPKQSIDEYQSADYFDIFSNTLLYAPADTFSFGQGHTRFSIAVFSENKRVEARDLYYIVQPVVQAIAKEWGYNFFDKHYQLSFYFQGKQQEPDEAHPQHGAVASCNSSFYILPEIADSRTLYRIAQPCIAHELLHLLTPCQLSTDRAYRQGLANEGMGKHLWLYEGVTEYLAWRTLLRQGILNEPDFWRAMCNKMRQADRFGNMSLVKLSEKLFKPSHQNAYQNAYLRGALAAMCLDIGLAQYQQKNPNSLYASSLPDLLEQLLQDAEQTFFDEQSLLTSCKKKLPPTVKKIFEQCIEGNKTLPFDTLLPIVGTTYQLQSIDTIATFGRFALLPDYKKGAVFFGKNQKNILNVQYGDRIVQINGKPVNTGNINTFLPTLYQPQPEDTIRITIERNKQQIYMKHKPSLYKIRIKHRTQPQKYMEIDAKKIKKNIWNK